MAAIHVSALDVNLTSAKKIAAGLPAGLCNTELQELRLKSYILLTHAALEVYFEETGLHAAKEAVSVYNSSGKITKSLLGLVSSKVLRDVKSKNAKKIASDSISNISVFAGEALSAYINRVKQNNGIKGENIKSILIPVGVEPQVEEVSAFNELNNLGTHRGEIAHTFIKTQHTFSAIQTSINTIRSGIDVYEIAIATALS